MLRIFLLSLFTIHMMNTNCGDGCLNCVNQKCRFCDPISGYIFSVDKCVLSTIENCEIFNNEGKCLVCVQDFQLDTSLKKCIKIAEQNMISNCANYTSSTTCGQCQKGFFLASGKCEQVVTEISNCEIQNAKNLCEVCFPGFVLSIDQSTCSEDPKVENCSTYSHIKCKKCSGGFLNNQNSYINSIFNFITTAAKDIFTSRHLSLNKGVIDMVKYKECQTLTIPNCVEYKDFNRCRLCSEGYYVNDLGYCDIYPIDSILFCKEYSSLTRCQKCVQGYWINDMGDCNRVQEIKNCAEYSSEVNKMNCVRCVDTHYLTIDFNCSERKEKFPNTCSKLAPDSETCLECVGQFSLTSDKKKCLPIIANCQIYVPSNFLTESFNCRLCEIGYYFNEEEMACKLGDIPNCEVYEKNANICEKCFNKYYLENNTCLPHDVLLNCEIYDQKKKNICLECNSSTFLFNKKNDCLSVVEIQNCAIYDSTTECKKCDKGYRLNDFKICEIIDPSFNCVEMIRDKCAVCLNDFVLQNGICYDSLDFFVNECQNHNIDGTNDYDKSKCFTCETNTVPFNYKDSFICVENQYMTQINKVNLDPNCLQYIGSLDGVFSCSRCKFPFVLDNGSCVQNCVGKTLYKQRLEVFNFDGDRVNESYSVNRVNVCEEKIPNCKIAAPDLIQNNPQTTTYVCIECDPGKISEIALNDHKVLILNPNLEESQFGKSPVSFHLPVRCFPTLDANNNPEVLGDINQNTKLIDNCNYYLDIGLKRGCTKCNHGYTGVVIDVVYNCDIYIKDQFTCKSCKQGYYLNSTFECKKVQNIEECILYSPVANTTRCIKCNPTFYANVSGICQKRVKSLNITNCTNIDTSDECTCNTGFFNSLVLPNILCDTLPTYCKQAQKIANNITCLTCDDKVSYLDQNGVCQPGIQTNCARFLNNKCVECNFQYYLVDGNCVAHSSISNCTEYNQTQKNTCRKCEKTQIVFEVSKLCKKVDYIEFCEEWGSIQHCKKCASGKRRTNFDRRCGAIPVDDHCLIQVPLDIDGNGEIDQKDQTLNNSVAELIYTCNTCENGYLRIPSQFNFINSDPGHTHNNTNKTKYICVDHWKYLKEQCGEHNISGTIGYSNTVKCNYCSANFFTKNFSQNKICLDRDYIKLHTQAQVKDPNCKIYTHNGTIYICTECKYPYGLDTDNICKTEISSKFIVWNRVTYDGNSNTWKKDVVDSSLSTDVANPGCNIKTKHFNDMNCVKCKKNYLNIIRDTIMSTNNRTLLDSSINNNSEVVIRDPVSLFVAVSQCKQYDILNATTQNHLLGNYSSVNKNIPFCEYYIEIRRTVATGPQIFHFGCARCKLGYSGVIDSVDPTDVLYTTKFEGYIKECSQMLACDMNHDLNKIANYGAGLTRQDYENSLSNLQVPLTSLFSCYKCTTAGEIPVVTVKFSNTYPVEILDYIKYDPSLAGAAALYNDISSVTGELFGHSTTCVDLFDTTTTPYTPKTSTVGVIINTPSIDPNCALAILNPTLDGNASNANNDTGTFDFKFVCVACNPGFKATRFTANQGPHFGVVSCEPIKIDKIGTHCSTNIRNTWFNNCEDCIHFYDIYTNKIHYDKCSPETDTRTKLNCFASYDIGPCVICQKGYLKDNNGNCTTLNIPRCQNTFYIENLTNLPSAFVQYDFHTMVYLGISDFNGCSKCNDSVNEALVILNGNDTNLPTEICISLPGTQPSIENCVNYGYENSEYKCKVCNGGFILTLDGRCTEEVLELNKCILANEIKGTSCITCLPNYLNVGGQCVDLATAPISNCAIYNTIESKSLPYAVCEKCNKLYYLNENFSACLLIDSILYPNCIEFDILTKSCLGCGTNYMLISHQGGSKCINMAITNVTPDYDTYCREIDQVTFNSGILSCKVCKNDNPLDYYIPTLNTYGLKSFCQEIGPIGNPSQASLCKRYDRDYDPVTKWASRSFKCLECTDLNAAYYDEIQSLCNPRTIVANCVNYNQFKDNCIECADNYLLSFDGLSCLPLPGALPLNASVNKGYLQYCEAMNSCASKIIYEGLHPHLSALFSCHACVDTAKIPFIGVRNVPGDFIIESLQEFAKNTGSNYRTGKNETAVQCLTPSFSLFNISEPNWYFPTNCGAGVINTEKSFNNFDYKNQNINVNKATANVSVYCGACKPGYKASYTTFANIPHPLIIFSCSTIANCESSTWFNYCSQCNPNHSYLYDPSQGVKFDTCINYSQNPDCFAVDNTDPSNKKCVFCKKGTFKNIDGFCEILNPPRCSLTNFMFRENYLIRDLNTGLYLSRNGMGCTVCDEGFVGLYTHQNDTVACTLSPYHKNNQVINTSRYIYQCLNYNVTPKGEFVCGVCKEGYVLTIDSICVINTNIANCELAFSASICKNCKPGYVNINRQCLLKNIQNCLEYGQNHLNQEQYCLRCAEGYYWKDNTCLLGTIKNCEVYRDENRCERCQKGWGIVRNKDEKFYCYPISPEYKCDEIILDDLQAAGLECNKCLSNRNLFYNDEQFDSTICMNFNQVKNCTKYDKKNSIAFSSYVCEECERDYYLSNGNCLLRINLPSKCIRYDLYQDKCIECEKGNFLSENGDNCVMYPNGIPNCLIYLNINECLICRSNFYLKEQFCYAVREEKKVTNCKLYQDEGICKECQDGFLIVEGECIQTVATGCKVWDTISSCRSCKDNNSGFKLENGVLNCVAKSTQNCIESEDWEPYKCLRCETNFYPVDGVCQAVINSIMDCKEYETETLCSRCAKGTALAQDRLSCLKTPSVIMNIDMNCEDTQLLEIPQCNTCKPGHYFISGYCMPCERNSLADGCYNCNPFNQNSCLLCQIGYYMHNNGKCYKNGTVPPEDKDNENPLPKPVDPVDPNDNNNNTSDSYLVKNNLWKMIIFFALVFLK